MIEFRDTAVNIVRNCIPMRNCMLSERLWSESHFRLVFSLQPFFAKQFSNVLLKAQNRKYAIRKTTYLLQSSALHVENLSKKLHKKSVVLNVLKSSQTPKALFVKNPCQIKQKMFCERKFLPRFCIKSHSKGFMCECEQVYDEAVYGNLGYIFMTL